MKKKLFSILFIGYVYADVMPLKHLIINVDNDTVLYPDSTGKFAIKLKQDSVRLMIHHAEFYTIDTLVQVVANQAFHADLVRRFYDYFPLEVGNIWKYDWSAYAYRKESGFLYEEDGLLTLEIINKQYKSFGVIETYFDSLAKTTTVNSFVFNIISEDSISASASNKMFEWPIRRMFNVSGNPYQSSDSTLRHGWYSMQKNVGVLNMHFFFGHIGGSTSKDALLIEYKLK